MYDHDVDTIMNVLGNGDRNLKMISDALKCELTVEDNKFLVSDEDKREKAQAIFDEMVL